MVIPPSIGVVLVLVGLALFLIDLKVTNHGLPTAGAILSLVAGGLALLGAGVPYSGVLLGVLVAGAMPLGGGVLFLFGSFCASQGGPALTGRGGVDGGVGTVRGPVGGGSRGGVLGRNRENAR